MNEDRGRTIRSDTGALQGIELPHSERDAIVAAAEANVATVARLAARIAFEDEPSSFARVLERVKG